MDGRAVAHGQQFLASVDEKNRPNGRVMAGPGMSAFARLDAPESEAKPIAGRDGLAIGRKGDGAVAAATPSERAQQTSRRDGPLAKTAVVAAVQTFAIRRKRHPLRMD